LELQLHNTKISIFPTAVMKTSVSLPKKLTPFSGLAQSLLPEKFILITATSKQVSPFGTIWEWHH
jgi:hypothetical protein